MYSAHERSELRDALVAAARADDRIDAAALVGSAAAGREDAWSDVDLALRLADGLSPADVEESWTALMYESHGAVDHVDVWAGRTLFRVFVLASSLQVDISFWPAADFAERGGPFRLVFGDANEPHPAAARRPEPMIGMAWLYALHARSSIARGRALQALYMLNGMRDQIISLACLRSALPPDQGRGADDLSSQDRARLGETVVHTLDAPDLTRAFEQLTDLLVSEASAVNPQIAERLRPVLAELVRSAGAISSTSR